VNLHVRGWCLRVAGPTNKQNCTNYTEITAHWLPPPSSTAWSKRPKWRDYSPRNSALNTRPVARCVINAYQELNGFRPRNVACIVQRSNPRDVDGKHRIVPQRDGPASFCLDDGHRALDVLGSGRFLSQNSENLYCSYSGHFSLRELTYVQNGGREGISLGLSAAAYASEGKKLQEFVPRHDVVPFGVAAICRFGDLQSSDLAKGEVRTRLPTDARWPANRVSGKS
jgi:hypothetical protein